MVWTNTASADFYKRFVREHEELFREETVEEARQSAIMKQSKLPDFSA
jgi:hypothetical protein